MAVLLPDAASVVIFSVVVVVVVVVVGTVKRINCEESCYFMLKFTLDGVDA